MPIPHRFIEREFTVYEALYNAVRYADQVSIVECDAQLWPNHVEYLDDMHMIERAIEGYESKVTTIINNWEERMYPFMPAIQYNIALSHCTGRWCFWHDADEVVAPDVYEAMRNTIESGHDADVFSLGTHHFYADYKHVRFKDPSGTHDWYDHKPRLFKNDLGIHHNKIGLDIDVLVYPNEEKNPITLSEGGTVYPIRKRVHHYGHVRSNEWYIFRKNWIEKTFHRDNAPVIEDHNM